MKKGVIDIGSNTVKAFVYEIDEKSIKTITSHRIYTHLYSYIENKVLNSNGINALCNDINSCKSFLRENNCDDIYCFATAALRDSENNNEVIKKVYDKCEVCVDLISGDIEAECDILSMKYAFGLDCALGMDMGGGSAQIFRYDNDEIFFSKSLPLGALKIKTMFVKDKFPTYEEAEKIKKYVLDILSQLPNIKTQIIYAMGGSIVELKKIFDLSCSSITVEMLEKLKDRLEKMPELDEYLKTVAQGREYTVLPAIIALLSIAEYFGANEFFVLENGVREGYLYRKILTQKHS